MVKFELRKIKYFEAGSEETPCFTAEIFEDGKKVADVKNDGHGGGNQIDHIHKLNTYQDVAKFDNMDVEVEIFERVYEDYDIRRLQTKGFVLKKDNTIKGHIKFPRPISKLKKAGNYISWRDVEIKNFVGQGYEVMNRNL